jgi:hypothetical protein
MDDLNAAVLQTRANSYFRHSGRRSDADARRFGGKAGQGRKKSSIMTERTERMTALLGGHVDMCATTLAGSWIRIYALLVTAEERNVKSSGSATLARSMSG